MIHNICPHSRGCIAQEIVGRATRRRAQGGGLLPGCRWVGAAWSHSGSGLSGIPSCLYKRNQGKIGVRDLHHHSNICSFLFGVARFVSDISSCGSFQIIVEVCRPVFYGALPTSSEYFILLLAIEDCYIIFRTISCLESCTFLWNSSEDFALMRDVGSKILEPTSRILDPWMLDLGAWIQEVGPVIQDPRCWNRIEDPRSF